MMMADEVDDARVQKAGAVGSCLKPQVDGPAGCRPALLNRCWRDGSWWCYSSLSTLLDSSGLIAQDR